MEAAPFESERDNSVNLLQFETGGALATGVVVDFEVDYEKEDDAETGKTKVVAIVADPGTLKAALVASGLSSLGDITVTAPTVLTTVVAAPSPTPSVQDDVSSAPGRLISSLLLVAPAAALLMLA